MKITLPTHSFPFEIQTFLFINEIITHASFVRIHFIQTGVEANAMMVDHLFSDDHEQGVELASIRYVIDSKSFGWTSSSQPLKEIDIWLSHSCTSISILLTEEFRSFNKKNFSMKFTFRFNTSPEIGAGSEDQSINQQAICHVVLHIHSSSWWHGLRILWSSNQVAYLTNYLLIAIHESHSQLSPLELSLVSEMRIFWHAWMTSSSLAALFPQRQD